MRQTREVKARAKAEAILDGDRWQYTTLRIGELVEANQRLDSVADRAAG